MSALFLSHAAEDRATAVDLKGRLERLGYVRILLSDDFEDDSAPDAAWEGALSARLKGADAVVALASPASVGSRRRATEVAQARALRRPVFPVRIESVELPPPLAGLHPIDVDPDLDAAVTALLRSLRAAGVLPAGEGVRSAKPRRRFALPLALSAAAIVAIGVWFLTRGTYVNVDAIPSARVLLDGREVGTTPLRKLAVEPGEHEIRLEHPRFGPSTKRFSVDRGSTHDVAVGLAALDPADPQTLKDAAAAAGIGLSDPPLEGDPVPEAAVVLLFPRGRMREAPTRVQLFARDGGAAHVVEIETVRGGNAVSVWRRDLPPAVGLREADLPAEVRAALGPGTEFRIAVTLVGGGAPAARSSGRVLSGDEGATLRKALAGFDAFPEGDPLAEFLRIEVLLRERVYEEAYERVLALAEKVGPPRKEITRLALAVLDGAGLRGETWWAEWRELHARAE